MPTYSGIRATDRAPVSSRFRATWTRGFFSRTSFFPPSAVSAVSAVQVAAPGRGFYVVSAPAVSPADDAIVLDVKTQTTWQGTAAALATALDAIIGGGFDLSALKLIPATESADAGADEREKVQVQAERAANAGGLVDTVTGVAKGIRSTVLLAAVAALAIALLVYAPQLKAAGRAVKRAVK